MHHPLSIVAVSGETAQFNCTVQNADGLAFRVNGTLASHQSIHDKGFFQSYTEILENEVISRILTVISVDDNAEIYCLATGHEDVESKIAELTVQGVYQTIMINKKSYSMFMVIKVYMYDVIFTHFLGRRKASGATNKKPHTDI